MGKINKKDTNRADTLLPTRVGTTNGELLARAHRLEVEKTENLERAIFELENAVESGRAVTNTLSEQGEKIKATKSKLARVQRETEIGMGIVSNFSKRMWTFLVLIVLIVVGIIVFAILLSKKSPL